MRAPAATLVVAVLIGAATTSGCGVGAGSASVGVATLRVTRDFGAEAVAGGTLRDPTASDTVVRFLDEVADIDTSYGDNFVESINGLAGSTVAGGSQDWFFFVNGYYSDVGAGEARVLPGDRIWWDYRRWEEAYRVPAVVGSYPEPFLHGEGGERPTVMVECLAGGRAEACDEVERRLRGSGARVEREDVSRPVAHPDQLRVLVGSWASVRRDPAAAQIEDGPSTSGVYASPAPCGGGYRLEILGSDARARTVLASAGFIAAVRNGDDQPTWVVSATAADMLPAAAALLDEGTLRDRYAVATTTEDGPLPIPASDDLPVSEARGC